VLKVLYLLNHAGKAGTERYVYSLIDRLNNNKIKAYFAYNEEGLLVERLKNIGVETFRIKMRSPFDLKAVWELNRLCRKLGIDLIHTHYLRENYISLLSRLINPRVRVMYTNHFILRNNAVQRVFNRLLTSLEAKIIAVCNNGKKMMVSNGIKKSRIEVIFNGVDLNDWSEPVKSTMRQELLIGEAEFVFLCASRFAHDKGHRFLVNSVAELKKMTDRPFKCVLAGDGPFFEDVKHQVEEMKLKDDIIFAGFRKDIKNFFYGSNLYVNSSEHEALSFLIIEAMASGLPVIATDMAGNGDIVNPETNCGILVEYNNPRSMAEAIFKLMNDEELMKRFRENALKAVREKFNLDKIVDETYNLYEVSCKKS
jgi:glycosyltransferase involved in cell wall biosynthesis